MSIVIDESSINVYWKKFDVFDDDPIGFIF